MTRALTLYATPDGYLYAKRDAPGRDRTPDREVTRREARAMLADRYAADVDRALATYRDRSAFFALGDPDPDATRPMVECAAWLSDDTDAVGIRDRDGRYYVVDRATYRAVRAAADPSAVPVPASAVRVPFDPFTAADAVEVTR